MHPSFARLVPAVAICLAGGGLHAADIALVATSPFFPGSTPITVSALTEGGPIELHGVESVGDDLRFSIYTLETQKAQWIGLNESGYPFVIRSHDIVDGSDQVVVDYLGSTLTLGLKSPRVAAATATGRGGRGGITPVQGGGGAVAGAAFQARGAGGQGVRGAGGAGRGGGAGGFGGRGAGGGRGGRGGGGAAAGANGGQTSTIAPDQAASILAAAAAARNNRAVANQQAAQTVDQATQRARGRAARGGQ